MKKLLYITTLCITLSNCTKLVDIKPTTGFVVTDQVFGNTDDAKAAVAGIFYKMGATGTNYANAGTTLLCGLSADELQTFSTAQESHYQFFVNSLISSNGLILSALWSPAYSVIYQANAVLVGLEKSTEIAHSTKQELMAKARFARAFSYFYLINHFGEIPLVTTINYKESIALTRSPVPDIYSLIKEDLIVAAQQLPGNYDEAGGLRVVPTKWAAKALLARIYLYTKNYSAAETASTDLINNSALFSLAANPGDVFLTTSKEAIWQIQPNKKQLPFYANQEAINFIPFPSETTSFPNFFLSQTLRNRFEPGDLRWRDWIRKTTYQGQDYFYPYKYRLGRASQSASTPFTECNTALRLSELYLIRAEARIHERKFADALNDLNKIRERSGLLPLAIETEENLLNAVYHEKQIEFFAEWGHRWFDLKRWGLASQVLTPAKGNNWQATDELFPLPASELSTGPNLTQNPGY